MNSCGAGPNRLRDLKVLVRGAGEQATGVAHCLRRCGLAVVATEVPEPLAVRRAVSFSEAVWEGETAVEGVRARRVSSVQDLDAVIRAGEVPVLVDPDLSCLPAWSPHVLVDATLAKRNLGLTRGLAPLVIALGPGFAAGADADIVVETQRGHDLGRRYEHGCAQPNTGVPEPVLGYTAERVLRAPTDGIFEALARIGDPVALGQEVGRVGRTPVAAETRGVLRGLLRGGVRVHEGLKVGDVDPTGVARRCFTVSDKARALGGSVLTAICEHFPW